MEELQLNKKRVRYDSAEFEFVSAEVKRLREDLLFVLDDWDPDQKAQEDLFSLMKSFEDEISAPSSTLPPPAEDPAAEVDLTLESDESQPDLGYLLGASDDELGLPPTTSTKVGVEIDGGKDEAELVRVDSADSVGMGEMWGVDGELTNYDAFELGDYEMADFGHLPFDYTNVVYDGLFE